MILKIRRPIKYSDSSSRADLLMTRATVLGISVQSFLLWLPNRTNQVSPPTNMNIFLLLMFIWPQVICNHFLKVSVYDILSQVFMIIHIYIYIYTYIHSHANTLSHTYKHKVWPIVYYSCHLVISSYHSSYQQYFNILP